MPKAFRPASSRGLGLSSAMPPESFEHRTKPARNRVRAKPIKPASTKPRAHRVGRSKR